MPVRFLVEVNGSILPVGTRDMEVNAEFVVSSGLWGEGGCCIKLEKFTTKTF